MKIKLLLVLLILTSYIYSQSEPPFTSESRFQLAGMFQPRTVVEFQELPLFYQAFYPLDFQREPPVVLLYFADSHSPYFQQEIEAYYDLCIDLGLQGLTVQTDGQGSARDYQGYCATLLGVQEYPSLYIFKDGRLVAYQQGGSMDWQNENLRLALEELAL